MVQACATLAFTGIDVMALPPDKPCPNTEEIKNVDSSEAVRVYFFIYTVI